MKNLLKGVKLTGSKNNKKMIVFLVVLKKAFSDIEKNLTLVLLLFTSVCSAQNNITNLTQFNIDRYVFDCCKELKIDSCMIVIQPSTKLIYDKYQGLTVKNSDNSFTIGIYQYLDFNETSLIIAHELVHVSQMLSGRLVVNAFNRITFDSVEYKANSSNEYYSPHEVEAHKIGSELFAKNKRIVYSPPPVLAKRY